MVRDLIVNSSIAPEVRANWQVPTFETSLWLGRMRPWCVVVPVINEGERIKSLLSKMATLKIDGIADIIIIDGGSTDDSLELESLQKMRVRGLLLKTGPGKLSAQLRCAYAFALDQGYEGIVTIDGNDKDDPEAISRFIDALKLGVDFVQASRFVAGGIAENTPASRDLAIRMIHAPALSFSSGFHWTDTTQGFRAYSRKMLLDPAINPFRSEFLEYELLAYLSHRVPQMGYQCLEIPTSRRYPKGEVPTKISAVKGNLKVLKTLLLACLGFYDEPGFVPKRLPSAWPIGLITTLGFIFSVLAFSPGWMSPDSFAQYNDAKEGVFRDWQPVLMAWWWRQLDQLYAGPALFLIQNLVLYWGAWCILAVSARRWVGRCAYLIPLLGSWPGLLFPLGQIWKDVAFACSLFFVWAVLINAYTHSRKLKHIERVGVFILGLFAFGAKTNGLVALPFVFTFWVYVEGWQKSSWFRRVALSLAISFTAVTAATVIVPQDRIIKTSPFQYTQTYDLLAISVKTGQNLLPAYITNRVGKEQEQLEKLYWPGGNNLLFYNAAGNMTTMSPADLEELNTLWLDSVMSYPEAYSAHRLDNFKELLRWGADKVAYVATPGTGSNQYGFQFVGNKFSDWLSAQPERHPWEFFPWVYLVALLVSTIALLLCNWHRVLVTTISLSAFAFVIPHFFVAPAADYRYLYYSYFCALVLLFYAVFACIQKLIRRSSKSKA